MLESGIFHEFSAPYDAATKGQAEKYVQAIKDSLKKLQSKNDVSKDVRMVLAHYRSMSRCTTEKTPSELFLGQKVRC